MGELKFKVHSLTGRITPELMRKAFKAVQRNRGAAGIDKVSIGRFQANLDQNLDALMRDIKTGAFRHLPLRRVFIPKPDGRQRPLGIPAVRDRVGQEVLRRLLNPIFEPLFHAVVAPIRPSSVFRRMPTKATPSCWTRTSKASLMRFRTS